ncbi:MAG: hypothetical protein M3P85_06435, partial [Actinomycetota bacterium]|nr:hypothetical protein [Actinomycetota bacterium]
MPTADKLAQVHDRLLTQLQALEATRIGGSPRPSVSPIDELGSEQECDSEGELGEPVDRRSIG